MSLTETSILEVVKKQYFFKLKAYMGLFLTMIAVQVLGVLLSLNGVMSSGANSGELFVEAKVFTEDFIIVMTMIWALIIARNLAINDYKKNDFVFVTNRLSSNLSSIGFVLTAAVIGGVTASLTGSLLRVLTYFTHGTQNIASQHFFIMPQELLLSMIATSFYIILISAIGYFFGALIQKHPFLTVLLPVLVIGLLILGIRGVGNISTVLLATANFFANESSLFLFMIKIIGVALIFFYSSILMSNRLEV